MRTLFFLLILILAVPAHLVSARSVPSWAEPSAPAPYERTAPNSRDRGPGDRGNACDNPGNGNPPFRDDPSNVPVDSPYAISLLLIAGGAVACRRLRYV